MQNSFIIFQKLLVLFGFMLIGYLSYKKKWISDDTSSQISGLIVNIFNPALIISGVIGSVGNGNWNLCDHGPDPCSDLICGIDPDQSGICSYSRCKKR